MSTNTDISVSTDVVIMEWDHWHRFDIGRGFEKVDLSLSSLANRVKGFLSGQITTLGNKCKQIVAIRSFCSRKGSERTERKEELWQTRGKSVEVILRVNGQMSCWTKGF